ncbi:S-adenosyl-L-methionine-dependent methyltransferase [Xylariomycetidae sp. FL0641]|nr:S-adenosyl-L-methionine-dependent methyltransferase [Xylariomycetidae sp. FL0641]
MAERRLDSPSADTASPTALDLAAEAADRTQHGVQPDEDADSALGEDSASSTASLSESILEYRTLHGRTYHSLRGNADYWGPNDERQNESLDLSHHTLTLLLDDKLFLAPIVKEPTRALDVGCGTGIWAIDFADMYPNCEVIGTDISPTQPGWLPPNLRFEIDDCCTQAWTYAAGSFDLVHVRYLFGSVPDWAALYGEAFRAARPGTGYLQACEASVNLFSDDGSLTPGTALAAWGALFQQANARTGRSMSVVEDGVLVPAVRAAGFVDVVERTLKCPLSPWPADPKLREVGTYAKMSVEQGLEGFALYLFTNALGWSKEQVMVYLARVRSELRNIKIKPYFKVQYVYGRKPAADERAE